MSEPEDADEIEEIHNGHQESKATRGERHQKAKNEEDRFQIHGTRGAAPNDRKLSDGGGLAQPARAKAARVGCVAAGAVKGSVAGGSARRAAQAVTDRSRSLQRLVRRCGHLVLVGDIDLRGRDCAAGVESDLNNTKVTVIGVRCGIPENLQVNADALREWFSQHCWMTVGAIVWIAEDVVAAERSAESSDDSLP
jgi:hypothetical protein